MKVKADVDVDRDKGGSEEAGARCISTIVFRRYGLKLVEEIDPPESYGRG